jgi:type IV pilus assembly protein PilB
LAQIAIQASLTGHLVFTTLHTNDAPGAITRLIDMGVEPFLISSTSRPFLSALVAEHLQ